MIVTALHTPRSPQNVGLVVRSQLALGSPKLIVIGLEKPWRFKKSSQAFSRKLEKSLEIVYIISDDDFFQWCITRSYTPIALEINQHAQSIVDFRFPENTVLVCGNEATGLTSDFMDQCAATIYVPQYGPVGSLNLAVSCSIGLHEYSKQFPSDYEIAGRKFIGE